MSVLIDRHEWDRQCRIVIKEVIPDAEPDFEWTPLFWFVRCYVIVPDGRVLTLERKSTIADMDWSANTRIVFEALAESFVRSVHMHFRENGWRYRDAIWVDVTVANKVQEALIIGSRQKYSH
jgi:hypothetical protein